jgi:hypothetical protein
MRALRLIVLVGLALALEGGTSADAARVLPEIKVHAVVSPVRFQGKRVLLVESLRVENVEGVVLKVSCDRCRRYRGRLRRRVTGNSRIYSGLNWILDHRHRVLVTVERRGAIGRYVLLGPSLHTGALSFRRAGCVDARHRLERCPRHVTSPHAGAPVATDPMGQNPALAPQRQTSARPNVKNADFNGDGKADYCRRVGGSYPSSYLQCTVSIGSGFGETFTSGPTDWGYESGWAWADFDGDRRADYCRLVGTSPDDHVQCTLSAGAGFGATITSLVLDWGYEAGRAWVDVNGDGKADYCRVIGNRNFEDSHVVCTLSTGEGFGATVVSPVLDWGYGTGRSWVGPPITVPNG